MIDIRPIPVLSDNYVWVIHADGASEAVVVDPGDGAAVARALSEHGLRLAAILLTHHHADHTGGVRELLAASPCPVFGPGAESIPAVDRPVAEGDRIELGPAFGAIEVIEVPGHTAGHVAYAGDEFVLCGDTLFAGGCGRVFEGTPGQMVHSLNRLVALGPSTRVYCAHEYTVSNLRFASVVEPENPTLAHRLDEAMALRSAGTPTVPSTIEIELDTNPFLRCGERTVIDAAQTHIGRALADEIEVFTVVRAWKDGWRG
jgi:hydroxyacylglutathione hydrolase